MLLLNLASRASIELPVVLDHRVDHSKLLDSQQRMKPVVVVIIGMLQSDVDIHTNNAAFPNNLMIIVYSVLPGSNSMRVTSIV